MARKQSLATRVKLARQAARNAIGVRYTALHHAANELDAELIAELIDKGEDPNREDVNYTPPIHGIFADRCGENPQMLKSLVALLGGGADPDGTEGHGVTSLMIVAGQGWTQAAKILVENGAALYYNYINTWDTALHWAIYNGQLETANFLAKRMKGVKAKDPYSKHRKPLLEITTRRYGHTPYLAACGSYWAGVEMLAMLEKCDVNTQAKMHHEENAWHCAANTCQHHLFGEAPYVRCNAPKMQYIFEQGLPGFDAETDWGKSPLHFAAQQGCTLSIALLLQLGAEIDREDNNGMTPLAEAVEKTHPAAVKLLLKADASPQAQYRIEGSTRHGRHTPMSAALDLNGWHDAKPPWSGWLRSIKRAFEEI